MSKPVKLSDITDELEMIMDEASSYLNKETGEVITIMNDELHATENCDDLEKYPEWQRDMIKMAADVFNNWENYVDLPSKFDVHEYNIMERFCLSIEDEEVSDSLYYAIKGSGAFRRFKDGIYRFDIADDWYRYRTEALREIAKKWCEDNEIEYVDA